MGANLRTIMCGSVNPPFLSIQFVYMRLQTAWSDERRSAKEHIRKHTMVLGTKHLTRIQTFNPKTSGNITQTFFLKSACPDSHLSKQILQMPQ
jgi:hypothetical protein